MKLAIFGATGRTGRLLLQQALQAGHAVTALARDPRALALTHERLTVLPGDALNAALVERAIAGAEAVLNLIGPEPATQDYVYTEVIGNIIAAMARQGVRRLITVAGAGVADPRDRPSLVRALLRRFVKLIAPVAYEDAHRAAERVRQSGLDWTIVRVPRLLDEPAKGEYRVGYISAGRGISRGDLAAFMLQQLDDTTYLRRAPIISD